MAKVTKAALTKHLEQLENDELRSEILELYGRFDNVKQYYKAELEDGNDSALLDGYKKKIYLAYNPKQGPGRRKNSICRKLIANFKKIAAFEYDIIDLQFYRVECALDAVKKQPKKPQRNYFSAAVISFDEGYRLMMKIGEEQAFEKRVKKLMKKSEAMPFDVHGEMKAITEKYRRP